MFLYLLPIKHYRACCQKFIYTLKAFYDFGFSFTIKKLKNNKLLPLQPVKILILQMLWIQNDKKKYHD